MEGVGLWSTVGVKGHTFPEQKRSRSVKQSTFITTVDLLLCLLKDMIYNNAVLGIFFMGVTIYDSALYWLNSQTLACAVSRARVWGKRD